MNDLEEFYKVVGSEVLPTYHYYLKWSKTQTLLEYVRLDDGSPKKNNVKWPEVWRDNGPLGELSKIEQAISKGKAKRIKHRRATSWFIDIDRLEGKRENG